MINIGACTYLNAKYYYITNNMWKHPRRTTASPNNLILVTEGTLYIEMQNERYAVNKGELLFLPHGIESIGYRPSTTNTAFYFVLFRSTAPVTFPTHFRVENFEKVSEMYALIINNARLSGYPRPAIDSLMHCLFYEVHYQLSHTGTPAVRTLAEAIKKYSSDTIFRNITVHEIAMHFGFSDDYINRVFAQAEHTTLKAFINKMRVKKIEELLISSGTPLSTVAKKLGFSSAAALSKFYKYHTGKTISDYRSKFLD